MWQDKKFDGKINYPDSFDIRDFADDLNFLQMAKASAIKSETFNKELDKQIAEAVIKDDEAISSIKQEIDSRRNARGLFETTNLEGQDGET
tara:strand:+ start:206 stop:478 length:273 start_codon:yes stop_codon:yes gene_type:complete